MYYTVRYAHLKNKPLLSIGDKVSYGDPIAVIGNTGKSYGIHLHIDLCEGNINYIWQQKDAFIKIIPNYKELNYFIDGDLFKSNYKISTYICEFEYMNKYGILHHGYDLYPLKGNLVYWNRNFQGTVIYNNFDKGYGNTVMICYKK